MAESDHPANPNKDRSSESRSPEEQDARIKLLNPLEPFERAARVVEMSRGAMKLSVDSMLLPGTLVQIRYQGKLLWGEVSFCEPSPAGFAAGVRLQDVFETD
ncbi:MAG TPA: hypothetical protein VKX39_17795 [Bryobacteraceae bacterium]|jgi:hypothetical protein|nr:hypothetical protein [Bryobacteraceae bacterium]